jgi:FMN phosphatase YigB (HAD superfamily)
MGATPLTVLYAGDSLERDVLPAMALGIEACLVARTAPGQSVPSGVRVVRDVLEIARKFDEDR